MKKISSLLLVLALLLTLLPATAMAADSDFVIVGLKDADKISITVNDANATGADLIAQINAAYTYYASGAGASAFDTIVGIVVTADSALSGSTALNVGGAKVVFNNVPLNIANGGVLDNSSNNYFFLGSNAKITVSGNGVLKYAVADKDGANQEAFNVNGSNITLGSGGVFTMAPNSTSPLTLSNVDGLYDAIDGLAAADVVSYDFTLAGAVNVIDRVAFSNKDRVTVNGTVTIASGKDIVVTDSASLTNGGTITGAGRLRTGDAVNYSSAIPTIVNNGTVSTNLIRIKCGGSFVNNGAIDNTSCKVTLENASIFKNDGTVNVAEFGSRVAGLSDYPDGMQSAFENEVNEVINNASATIIATTFNNKNGEITNYGTITAATIDNTGSGVINNYGGDITGPVTGSDVVERYNGGISWGGISTMTYSARANTSYWTGGDLVITSTGSYSDFISLYVDNKLIDPAYYTATSGSTIVTIDEAILRSLSDGSHTFRLRFDHGNSYVTIQTSAITTPNVVVQDPPKVGTSLTALGFLFLALALAAIVARRKVRA
ncbi:hypothetical protein LJC27_07520 [Christensenellaceae bacterium OttesenSCG-928-M15]|nr:hypothetical protein [Christensenellaceae bacterium OttesenSCG-928-M15]